MLLFVSGIKSVHLCCSLCVPFAARFWQATVAVYRAGCSCVSCNILLKPAASTHYPCQITVSLRKNSKHNTIVSIGGRKEFKPKCRTMLTRGLYIRSTSPYTVRVAHRPAKKAILEVKSVEDCFREVKARLINGIRHYEEWTDLDTSQTLESSLEGHVIVCLLMEKMVHSDKKGVDTLEAGVGTV